MPICVDNFYSLFQLLLPLPFSSHDYTWYSLSKNYSDHRQPLRLVPTDYFAVLSKVFFSLVNDSIEK